jgi:hypothetical protein
MSTNTNQINASLGLWLSLTEAETVASGLLDAAAERWERIREAEAQLADADGGATDYTFSDVASLRVEYDVLRRIGEHLERQLHRD